MSETPLVLCSYQSDSDSDSDRRLKRAFPGISSGSKRGELSVHPHSRTARIHSHSWNTSTHYLSVAGVDNSAIGACSLRVSIPPAAMAYSFRLMEMGSLSSTFDDKCMCMYSGVRQAPLASLHMILTRFEEEKIPNQILAVPGIEPRTHRLTPKLPLESDG